MNCTDVQTRFSEFYDRELASERRKIVQGHIARCATCTDILNSYQRLTRLCRSLPDPMPATSDWSRIAIELQAISNLPPVEHRRRWMTYSIALASIAAVLLVLLGINFLPNGDGLTSPNAADGELAVNFRGFLDQFPRAPRIAQQELLRNFDGKSINAADAIQLVGYQPSALRTPPQGYSLQSVYVLKMPCCVCIEAVFRGNDGRLVAIFEQAKDQPIWFEGRPRIKAHCNDRPASIIQLDGHLAVTWKQQQRYITVIGLRDVEEVARLVTQLDGAPYDLG